MRSAILRTCFVSCSWLVVAACSAASSPTADPADRGGAGGPIASAGAPSTFAGAPAAGASGSSTDAGGGGASAGDSSSAGAPTSMGGVGGVGSSPSSGGASGSGPLVFVHPGILVNQGMLDFVKAKIAAGAAPWKGALSKVSGDSMGSLSYTATPHATVECGPSSNPDIGCTDEKNDVIAAYSDALIWYYTGDQKHADKAIQIMNAWSAVLKKHTNDNEQLQASWAAEIFPRAAEIIRYSSAGWSAADIEQFKTMLKTAYLPEVVDGSTRTGNWDTSAIEAAMNIAIFLDDTAEFQKAVSLWRARTPAYVYLSTDGALPVQPPRRLNRCDLSDAAFRGTKRSAKEFHSQAGRPSLGVGRMEHGRDGPNRRL